MARRGAQAPAPAGGPPFLSGEERLSDAAGLFSSEKGWQTLRSGALWGSPGALALFGPCRI